MPLENEARFHLPETRLESTIRRFNSDYALDGFRLSWRGKREHSDTYFDAAGNLRSRGWSLRIRTLGDNIRATLKRPAAELHKTHGVVREELENDSNESLFEVLAEIIEVMHGAEIVAAPPDAVGQLMLSGVYPALRAIGLRDLFTVRTARYSWIITVADEDIAELVVDDSYYDIGTVGQSNPIRECRVEVELLDAARQDVLDQVARILISRYEVREVTDSKFERGMLHFTIGGLHEKLETKFRLKAKADYDAIIKQLNSNSRFLPQYRFKLLPERAISDIYFETADQRLFQVGCYLRLRKEARSRELVFRRLAGGVKYGEVVQEEIIAKGDAASFGPSWQLIQSGLKSLGLDFDSKPAELDHIEDVLSSIGLTRILYVDTTRQPWFVECIDNTEDGDSQSEHVAKLKYDRVTYRRPDGEGGTLSLAEFEATGLEDEAAAPQVLRPMSFEAFAAQFERACGRVVGADNVSRKMNAKYFHGMINLGIAKVTPDWLGDDRLLLRASLLRDLPSGPSPAALHPGKEQLAAAEDAKLAGSEVTSVLDRLQARLNIADRNLPASDRDFLTSLERSLRDIARALERMGAPTFSISNVMSQTSVNQNVQQFDMKALARSLDDMLVRAKEAADGPAGIQRVVDIAAAREAAEHDDEPSVIAHMKKLGNYAGELAKQIGVPVLTDFLKFKLGIHLQ